MNSGTLLRKLPGFKLLYKKTLLIDYHLKLEYRLVLILFSVSHERLRKGLLRHKGQKINFWMIQVLHQKKGWLMITHWSVWWWEGFCDYGFIGSLVIWFVCFLLRAAHPFIFVEYIFWQVWNLGCKIISQMDGWESLTFLLDNLVSIDMGTNVAVA